MQRPAIPRPIRIVLVTFGVAGCLGAGPDGEWQGTIETLPDGRVRAVNSARGLWDSGQPWRLAEDLVLGETEGAGAQVFPAVSGLEVDDDGRIYVLDRQANELRIFAADGSHVKTVGRSGQGPGEYSNANGLHWIGPDSLLVIDQRGNRYSILTRDGGFVRTVPRNLGFYGWASNAAFFERRVWEQSSVRSGDEVEAAFIGVPVDAGPAGAATFDTLMLPEPPATRIEPFSIRTERGGMVMGVPHAPAAVYHLDAAGRLWHGWGGAPRIFRSTLAGDTTLEIVVDLVPAPVTAAEIEDWRSGEGITRFLEMGGQLDMDRIPASKPLFDGIFVDPDGFIWLSTPAGAGRTAFAVLDPDGRYLGRLQVDGMTRDAYVPPVVRNGNLHFVGRDALDVQRVYRFRIER